MTNFEKIKQMSVDELARFLTYFDDEYDSYFVFRVWDSFEHEEQALNSAKKWLESEASNEQIRII